MYIFDIVYFYIYVHTYVHVKVCNSVYVYIYILHDYTFSTVHIVSIPTASFNCTKEIKLKSFIGFKF